VEPKIKKDFVNITDTKMSEFLYKLDPLHHNLINDFSLIIRSKEILEIFGLGIYVKSLIFPDASSNEIKFGIDLLFEQKINEINITREKFFHYIYIAEQIDRKPKSVGNQKAINSKLALLNTLRLAYYYYKCSNLPSFSIKANEIKTKLSRSLDSIEKEDLDFEVGLDIFIDNIKHCCSELMFSFITLYSGKNVVFNKKHDLMIEGFPCEVKSINDKMISDVKDDKIILSQKGEEFGEIGLIQELIIQIIRNKWKDHLIYAIERQNAKIILFHTDSSLIMNDLNAWCRSFEPDEICFSYSNILDITLDFLRIINKMFIPLIICSSIASIKFDQRYVLAKIPIIRNSVNENKLDHNRFNESNIENTFFK
jgi:hypothetical protein